MKKIFFLVLVIIGLSCEKDKTPCWECRVYCSGQERRVEICQEEYPLNYIDENNNDCSIGHCDKK